MKRRLCAFEKRMEKLASFGKHKIAQRRCMWMKKYNGTMAQYVLYTRVMHCEICGDQLTDDNGGSKRCQDHCHNTGRMRGVLCNACNAAQGYLRSKENAMKMVEYFVRWEIIPTEPESTETTKIPDAYERLTLFDVLQPPLGPPLDET